MTNSIRMLNYALDDSPLRGGSIILRGVIHPDDLQLLKIDDYQREHMHARPSSRIMQALSKGEPFPDIEIGMRGQKYQERGDYIFLQDDIFIIDGVQRVSNSIRFMAVNQGTQARIGAMLHFNTTKDWERERFDVLNTSQLRVSPNVLLRNKRELSQGIGLLYEMCNEDTRFALHKRVQWNQRMTREELISCVSLCKVVLGLHRHLGTGAPSPRVSEISAALDRAIDIVGATHIKGNLRTFFDLIDECFGVRNIQYTDLAIQIRLGFLSTLAAVLSEHETFWQTDKKLAVAADLRSKLKKFRISDPSVKALAVSNSRSNPVLRSMIIDHLNHGKRTGHLRQRKQEAVVSAGSVASQLM